MAAEKLKQLLDTYTHNLELLDIEQARTLLQTLTPRERFQAFKRLNRNGKTPLHAASEKGDEAFIKCLLEYTPFEQRPHLLQVKNAYGFAPFSNAVYNGRTGVIELLLLSVTTDHRYNLLKTSLDAMGQTILHSAARTGNVDSVKLMLESVTSDIQQKLLLTRDKLGKTPIDEAVYCNQTEMAACLEEYLTLANVECRETVLKGSLSITISYVARLNKLCLHSELSLQSWTTPLASNVC